MNPNYYTYVRAEMVPFIPEQRRRILDVGCGEGRFAASLTGVEEVWGIEPSPAAEAAKERLNRVFRATFDEAEGELPRDYFDVVVCNDVIEHMPDPNRFLSVVKQHMAPGGVLVGSIPNVRFYNNVMQFLLEKDWHYTDSGILDRTHITFFTEKSLRRTLERHGYDVKLMQGINTGAQFSSDLRTRIYLAAARVLAFASAGYFSDMLHLQFAFQAVPRR